MMMMMMMMVMTGSVERFEGEGNTYLPAQVGVAMEAPEIETLEDHIGGGS